MLASLHIDYDFIMSLLCTVHANQNIGFEMNFLLMEQLNLFWFKPVVLLLLATRESKHMSFYFMPHAHLLHNERDMILALDSTQSVSAGVRRTPSAPGYDAVLDKG